MRCAHGDTERVPKTVRRRYGSAQCRAVAWKHGRAERDARVKVVVTVVAKAGGVTPRI
jgi:hypothetical protein